MTAPRSWPTWRRDAAALGAVVLLGWLAYVRGGKVPVLGLVDLGFHELGHLVTYVFPDLVTAVSGSLVQVLVPIGLAAYFLLRRAERASAAVCLAWAGTSAADAAVYVADAPFERLELLGNGEHDWAFALGPDGFDVIEHAAGIATAVRGLGLVLLVAAAACSLWPLIRPARAEPAPVTVRWTETSGAL